MFQKRMMVSDRPGRLRRRCCGACCVGRGSLTRTSAQNRSPHALPDIQRSDGSDLRFFSPGWWRRCCCGDCCSGCETRTRRRRAARAAAGCGPPSSASPALASRSCTTSCSGMVSAHTSHRGPPHPSSVPALLSQGQHVCLPHCHWQHGRPQAGRCDVRHEAPWCEACGGGGADFHRGSSTPERYLCLVMFLIKPLRFGRWVCAGMRMGFDMRQQAMAAVQAKVLRLNSAAIADVTSGKVSFTLFFPLFCFRFNRPGAVGCVK